MNQLAVALNYARVEYYVDVLIASDKWPRASIVYIVGPY